MVKIKKYIEVYGGGTYNAGPPNIFRVDKITEGTNVTNDNIFKGPIWTFFH
jgi:hypothetical protein